MEDIKYIIEEKAMQYITEKGATAITIHGPSFGCPCCSSCALPFATLHLPASRLDIYDRHLVRGIIVYFPRGVYGKLSIKKTVRITLEGFWFFKGLAVYGFSYTH